MPRLRLSLVVALVAVAAQALVLTAHAPVADAAAPYQSLPAPMRLLDTRPGASTADNQFDGEGVRPADSVLQLTVAGRVGLPGDPAAVVLNVTVTEPAGPGFVTVFPCDQPRPTASSLNYSASQTVPNAVIATVGGGGDVCLYTLQQTHLIVDVSGWFPDGGFVPLAAPQRLLDTRPDGLTADGAFANVGVANFSVIALPVAGRAGIAPDATSVALNVTVTEPGSAGFLTVFPCGATQPNASNLNFGAGQTVPNLVISRIGTGGAICIYVHARAHVVVDASGTLPNTDFQALDAPQRLLDTRPGTATSDGQFLGEGTQNGGATLQLRVAGRAGIPTNATAAVLNVTAVSPAVPGFVTVHPRGTTLPTASNLNHMPGAVVANVVIARIGAGGDVCVFTSGATDLVVDVAGWLVGPEPAASGPNCPSVAPNDPNAISTLLARPALHAAVGVDRIALLACDLIGDPTPAPNPGDVADWANATVTPYFLAVSGGKYRPDFYPHPLGRISGDQGECVFGGRDETLAPFTNVIVYDSGDYGGGQAGPGYIWSNIDNAALSMAPRDSFRGGWVGGGVPFVDRSVLIHEIGHTIHWPHSYTGATDEYDNPIDIMSGQPRPSDEPISDEWCPHPGGGFIWCKPQYTIAFNRMAAGWLSPQQVAIHRSGRAIYTLDATGGNGVQMVALPDAGAPLSSMVIDARPTSGYDEDLFKGGVAVHLVDQGNGGISTISTGRRQMQAAGGPESYAHVVGVGETLVAHGVRITVTATAGNGYEVVVVGRYSRPGSLFQQSLGEPSSCAAPNVETITPNCWK